MSAETAVAPLTRAEWRILVDAGALDDQRVELLGGKKWHMAPEGPLHTLLIEALARQLRAQLDDASYHVHVAHPLALDDISEPEPDIAVVRSSFEQLFARREHPRADEVALLIEVSGTSRSKDLGVKAQRYAAAGIAEYWVVDLGAQEVMRHTLEGAGYSSERTPFGEPLRCASVDAELTVPV